MPTETILVPQRNRRSRNDEKDPMGIATQGDRCIREGFARRLICLYLLKEERSMQRVCKECKEPIVGRRGPYCSNRHERLYNLRRSKQRRNRIPSRKCAMKQAMLDLCDGCVFNCDDCHNVAPIKQCYRSRLSRYNKRYRRVCPRDCKECIHFA